MDKNIINSIRRNFTYAAEDKRLYRERLLEARKYRLEGDRKLAMISLDIATGYRRLAINANKDAIWWIKLLQL